MTTHKKCRVCGGLYVPIQEDGQAYYHTCPSLGYNPDGTLIPRPGARNQNLMQDQQTGEVKPIANSAGDTSV